MLTREGFVVADMSAPTPLQRSSWKAEAIRKGNLKISGPIPITEDTPLNEEEEKEFAEKSAQDGALQPQDALEESQRPQTPQRPLQSPTDIPEHPTALRSNPIEQQPQRDEESYQRQPSRSPPKAQHANEVQRESVVQPTPVMSPTPFRSTPESTSKTQKKRKSGLRNVFRKMFGRKSRDEAENIEEETTPRGHSYHHSDPGMLGQSPPRERQSQPERQRTPTGPRISDLPVKELQPLHPLGQHLPYPMNVNAPPASPPQEYLDFDMQRMAAGRRRATLPTLPSADAFRHSSDDVRGKLPTWEEGQDEAPMSSPGIGIALSGPVHPRSSIQSKRRSRSADALVSLAKGRASVDRGRSAEIKYWRESYMSGSVYSRPQTAKTVETMRSVQAQEPDIREPDTGSFNGMSATLVQAGDSEAPTPVDEVPRENEREFQPPVSAFNFGDFENTRVEQESVPEPVAHEEPAAPQVPSPPPRHQKRLSIEERVLHLESKYDNLDALTRRISTRNNRQTIILENAPRNLRSRNRSTSTHSRSVSRSAPSIHQEPIPQPSTDTLKANHAPASPTLCGPPMPGTTTNDEIRNLYDALAHERSARKALESQVLTLQHDISDLHALVNKLIVSATATSPSYPTPSPDTLILSSSEHHLSMATPRATTYNRTLVYGAAPQRWASESCSESEFEDEAGNHNKHLFEGGVTPEVWATPKEERFASSGFFTRGEGERL